MENESKKCCGSYRIILSLVGMVLLATIVSFAILRDRIVNRPMWQMSFMGQGRVSYVPDIAKLSLGVRVNQKAKAEEALSELNAKIEKILSAVEKTGIAKEKIETQAYSLTPHYSQDGNMKLVGYDATQTILVRVEGIRENQALLNSVVKSASEAGANQVNGVSFEPLNLEDLKQEARILAIEDAQKKANDLSARLNVRLDDIVGWWENYPVPMPYYDQGGYGGGGGAPMIPTGSNEVVVEVNLSYNIK